MARKFLFAAGNTAKHGVFIALFMFLVKVRNVILLMSVVIIIFRSSVLNSRGTHIKN